MATELILIRHGHAVDVNGDYIHAPLTSLGQEQAAQTGEYFNAPQNHQEVRLIESLALVILEFFSVTEPVEDYLDARAGSPIRWPIVGRVSAVLLDILSRHPNQRVAVIAHAGVISAALSWYRPKQHWQWWRTTVSNCSLTRFGVEGNRAELLAVNDIHHLSPVPIAAQPPTTTVEIAEAAHPIEKALLFEKATDKINEK